MNKEIFFLNTQNQAKMRECFEIKKNLKEMQTLPDSSKSLKLNQEEIKHPKDRTKKSPDIYIKKKQTEKTTSNIIISDA